MNPLSVLNIVPSWLWAALLAGAALMNCATHTQLQAKRVEVASLKTEAATRAKVQAEALSAETEKTRVLEQKLANAAIRQEKTDAKNKELSRQAGVGLANSLVDGRLRDPNAPSCSDRTQTQDPAGAGTGDKDGAPASGLLSVELTSLLQQLTEKADTINDAYASCRESSRALRKALEER